MFVSSDLVLGERKRERKKYIYISWGKIKQRALEKNTTEKYAGDNNQKWITRTTSQILPLLFTCSKRPDGANGGKKR